MGGEGRGGNRVRREKQRWREQKDEGKWEWGPTGEGKGPMGGWR